MTTFKGNRVVHEFTQANPAPPEKVFPLLCPVREADWLPGWEYRMIYSESGIAESGCVFTAPNASGKELVGAETTWIVTEYDPDAFRIAFVWIHPEMIITEVRIRLTPAANGTTCTHIRYRYTGLSLDGNRELAGYDQKWFAEKMQNWERMMNHYLLTGTKAGS